MAKAKICILPVLFNLFTETAVAPDKPGWLTGVFLAAVTQGKCIINGIQIEHVFRQLLRPRITDSSQQRLNAGLSEVAADVCRPAAETENLLHRLQLCAVLCAELQLMLIQTQARQRRDFMRE